MPLFWKPYTSDVTTLIEELRTKKPSLEATQEEGMALLWNQSNDARAQAEYREAQVPQQAYVYQTKAH